MPIPAALRTTCGVTLKSHLGHTAQSGRTSGLRPTLRASWTSFKATSLTLGPRHMNGVLAEIQHRPCEGIRAREHRAAQAERRWLLWPLVSPP